MPSIYQRMSTVRAVWLRGPRVNRPGDLQLLHAVSLHTKILRAKRRNTGNAWDYATVNVNVRPDKAKYQINDTRFGRPLAVITVDPANPQHVTRRIPFFTPQNVNFDWGWPADAGSWIANYDGSFHSAERVAFHWEDGWPYVEFLPTPKLNATYMVEFSVGDSVDVMSLTDELHLGEIGDSLVELRAARTLLPSTEWEAMDAKANVERRREIGTTITMDEPLLMEQFQADALIGSEQTMGRQWSSIND